jgi:hypothetical protein
MSTTLKSTLTKGKKKKKDEEKDDSMHLERQLWRITSCKIDLGA